MSLHFKKIESLLIKRESETRLARIIIDYSTLKHKLENPDNQSWYCKRGIESNKQKLLSLTKEYEEIRNLFNESSIDYFIANINENLKIKSWYERNGMNTIQQMHYLSIISKNEFFSELVRLKSKTELLMPIDYYCDNPEEFVKFID